MAYLEGLEWLGGVVGSIAGSALQAVVDWLLSVVGALATLATGVIELLPMAEDLNLDLPDGWVYGYSFLNTFLPISEALGLLTAVVALHVGAIAYRLAVVAYHLIPKPAVGT